MSSSFVNNWNIGLIQYHNRKVVKTSEKIIVNIWRWHLHMLTNGFLDKITILGLLMNEDDDFNITWWQKINKEYLQNILLIMFYNM